MPYPIRHYLPGTVYFITSRCTQSRLLMTPSAMVNELIGAALARAVRLSGIDLHAFVFTSNHFHLMLSSDAAARVARFMQLLQSDIARKVGRLVKWSGRFFSRRYSAEPIADDDAADERLRYILAHGVKEGLVAACADWPGLSCLQALKCGGPLKFEWRDWTKRWFEHRRKGNDVDRFGVHCPKETETLSLAPLPSWRDLSQSQRSSKVTDIERRINETAPDRVKGAGRVLAQDPLSRPRHTKRSQRPKCHASSLALWRAMVTGYREFLSIYRDLSTRWRGGDFSVRFPAHCFRPAPGPFCEECET